MQKKVLMAAVNDYQGFAPDLTAPATEVERWGDLLSSSPYGMTILPPLIDQGATRASVLAGLENLLKDASPHDQLLFACFAHGTIMRKRETGGLNEGLEQAIIFYPNGDPDLENAAVTYSDVLHVLRNARLPEGVDLVFLIESCFAAAFVGGGSIPMFIEPSKDIDLRTFDGPIARFVDLATPSFAERTATPIILAAASEHESAYEVSEGMERRLLFSLRAVDRLRQNQDTFDQLIANITPLRPGYPQTPCVIGRPEQTSQPFPGGRVVPPTASIGAPAPAPTGASSTTAIRMRVLGMACFIGPKPGSKFAKRIVLPLDTWPPKTHFAFLEVADEDAASVTGVRAQKHYYRGGVNYSRWYLSGHRIELANPDGSTFTSTVAFRDHVPPMTKVTPELASSPYPYPYPADYCYDTYPNTEKGLNGFVDLASGTADAGKLGPKITFVRRYGGDPTFGPIETPLSVTVDIPFTGSSAILLISSKDGRNTQIFLKNGAAILAGVAREEDITGTGSGDGPPEAFLIYYNLVDSPPNNLGIPAVAGVPINACTVTGYP